MKRSRHRCVGALNIPFLLLTDEDLVWLKHALFALEVLLASKPHSFPKVLFARETVAQVQGTLAHLTQHQWGYEVPFTTNELVILHTAVCLFVVGLEHLPDSAEKQEAASRCLGLCSRLDPLVAVAVRKT